MTWTGLFLSFLYFQISIQFFEKLKESHGLKSKSVKVKVYFPPDLAFAYPFFPCKTPAHTQNSQQLCPFLVLHVLRQILLLLLCTNGNILYLSFYSLLSSHVPILLENFCHYLEPLHSFFFFSSCIVSHCVAEFNELSGYFS